MAVVFSAVLAVALPAEAAAKEPASARKGQVYGGELASRFFSKDIRRGGWLDAVQFRVSRDGRWVTDIKLSGVGSCPAASSDVYAEFRFHAVKLRIKERGRQQFVDPGRSLWGGISLGPPPDNPTGPDQPILSPGGVTFDAVFALLHIGPPAWTVADHRGGLLGRLEFWKGKRGNYLATGGFGARWYWWAARSTCTVGGGGEPHLSRLVAGRHAKLEVDGLREHAEPSPLPPEPLPTRPPLAAGRTLTPTDPGQW